jgi:hypothetical protein
VESWSGLTIWCNFSGFKRGLAAALFTFACLAPISASAQDDVESFRADAAWIFDLIDNQYAYLDRFDGRNPARGESKRQTGVTRQCVDEVGGPSLTLPRQTQARL